MCQSILYIYVNSGFFMFFKIMISQKQKTLILYILMITAFSNTLRPSL